ncbi:MAG: hypothetical protein GZ091_14660 [Paludibacter sp.]|nr:hypothetical protein [Paludibacter sp.]
MKKQNLGLGIIIVSLVIGLVGCSTSHNSGKVDLNAINTEISYSKSALNLSKAYSDTLKMYYDTVKVKHNNVYCMKYDKLYHKNDSLFTMHYNMFGEEMYKGGFMMNNYTPGSMMGNNGMMGTGGMMNATLRSDTTMMNGYYNTMHQLRINHQTYHNGIYN